MTCLIGCESLVTNALAMSDGSVLLVICTKQEVSISAQVVLQALMMVLLSGFLDRM